MSVLAAIARGFRRFIFRFPGTAMFIAIVLAIYCYRNLNYFIDFHPEQNECEFVTTTNGEFVAMLSRADELARWRWPALTGSEREIRQLLNQRMREIAGDDAGIYRKLAAMHAVLRQMNGYLSRIDQAQYKAWCDDFSINRSIHAQDSVGFDYNVPSLSVRKVGILFNEELVHSRITILWRESDLPSFGVEKNGAIGTGIIFSHTMDSLLGKGFPLSGLPQAPVQCPPLPPEDWAKSYDAWQHKLTGARK